jgi:hypothetical protein
VKGRNFLVDKFAKAVAKGFVVGGEEGSFDHGSALMGVWLGIFRKQMLCKKEYSAY